MNAVTRITVLSQAPDEKVEEGDKEKEVEKEEEVPGDEPKARSGIVFLLVIFGSVFFGFVVILAIALGIVVG